MPRRLLYLLILFVVASLLLFVQLPIPPTYAGRTIENAGHTPLFAVVTLAVLWVLRHDGRIKGYWLYAVAGVIGVGLGLLSEIIQRPLKRDASWEDVFADAVGVMAALAVYALFDRRNLFERWHRVLAVLIALGCIAVYLTPVVNMTRAYLHRNGQFPVLVRFDSRTELSWTLNIGVRREIVDGALNVEFVAEETPGIGFYEPVPDWRDYKTLVVDVENPASEALRLGVRVHDERHNNTFADRFNRHFTLAAGERKTLRISLDDVRHGPRNRLMDMAQISNITLFRAAKTGSKQLRVHSIRLE